jgi:2-keto-3-deoxy-6-phosphogluconate aldolase
MTTTSLPPVVLAHMRAMAESLMTDTCTIEVRADAVDSMGAVSNVWTAVESGVRCRMITIGFRPQDVLAAAADRRATKDSYRLVCPAGTALAPDQRVTLDSDGSQWLVTDLVTRRTDETDTQAVITRYAT